MAGSAWNRGVIAIIGVSLSLGSMTLTGAVAAAPAADGSARVAGSAASIAAALPEPDPDYVMPKIPVWVNMGDTGLGNVTVSVLDAKGKVRVTARTNDSGVVLIPRTFLRGQHSLTVTGGKAWERLGRPTLSTGELIGDRNAVIIISPLTAIAHRVAKITGTSYTSALLRTRKAHGIASHVDHFHAAATDLVFHTGTLREWSKKHGSLHAGMDHLAKRIANGKSVPGFAPPVGQARADSEEDWVGQTIMKGILSESGSYGAEMALGNVFGFSDPDAAALSEINSELKTIITELSDIEKTLQELVYLVQQTSYQVLASGMSDLAGAVNGNNTGTGLWAVYVSATSLDPSSPSYESDIAGFATAFYNGVYAIIPSEVGELFDTPTSQGLLHQLYSFNTAPWWNANDVETISNTIDYYGTLQAQAVGLVNEAWSYRGPGANPAISLDDTDINIFNTSNYGPQSADIYLSIPTQIDDASVVYPKTQTIYRGFPRLVWAVQNQKSGDNLGDLPVCNNDSGTLTVTLPWPPVIPSTKTWDDTWAASVPSGWTVQPAAALNNLSATRQLPNASGQAVKTYTLPTFSNNISDAFALSTSSWYPRAGYPGFKDQGTALPGLGSWMWCSSSGVSLANTEQWLTNFSAYVNRTPSNVPSGAPQGWEYLPIKVLVLGAQQGSFQYVAPTPSG